MLQRRKGAKVEGHIGDRLVYGNSFMKGGPESLSERVSQETTHRDIFTSNFEYWLWYNCNYNEVWKTLEEHSEGNKEGQSLATSAQLTCLSPMLNPCASNTYHLITVLFNISIMKGKIPDAWKESLITSFPKSSDLSLPINHRPISPLSILSKLLERHITWFVFDHHALSHYIS